MAFIDVIQNGYATDLELFGEPASFYPQTGGGPISITGITKRSVMEDTMYGGTPGVVNVLLFVLYANISPSPQRGDTINYGGATYDVDDVLVDRMGGATLKMHRNA